VRMHLRVPGLRFTLPGNAERTERAEGKGTVT